jgi:hypothetical protein
MPEPSPLPLDFYRHRASQVGDLTGQANGNYTASRMALTVTCLLALAVLYQSFIPKTFPVWSAALMVPLIVYLGYRTKACQQTLRQLRSLRDYYDRGIARLGLKWDALDDGTEFTDHDHLYATDLDLFGRGSVFQVLCSARTKAGRETLANWMKSPATFDEALARQAAVAELRPRRELRESIAAAGAKAGSEVQPATWRAWIAEGSAPFPLWAAPLALMLAICAVVLAALYGIHVLTWHGFLFGARILLPSAVLFAWSFHKRATAIMDSLSPLAVELPILCELLRTMERERFSSPKLSELAARLKQDGTAASRHVHRLQTLVGLLKGRDGTWFGWLTVPSYAVLWATQFAMAIDRWRQRHGNQLLDWLDTLSEFEALLSIATYSFEHPQDVFPELVEGKGPLFEALALGHVLLDESTCVRNDVRIGSEVRFLIVSGSNMSGKSTFLRAIGVNAVLAWMGAPVRCAKLRISRLAIGAAIRMEDSVVDGRSHFFAEMERLRQVIELAGETPLLFLADEIMSGTNSHDRRIAAEWVVRALMLRNAIGLITTHDLALTEIVSNGLPGGNVCFEDGGVSGNLKFDYKLRDGLLTRSNALNIAHMLGIDTASTSTGAPVMTTITPPAK